VEKSRADPGIGTPRAGAGHTIKAHATGAFLGTMDRPTQRSCAIGLENTSADACSDSVSGPGRSPDFQQQHGATGNLIFGAEGQRQRIQQIGLIGVDE
jgi:hypothetical protein